MTITKLLQNHVPQCQGTDLCLQVIFIWRRQGNNALTEITFWLMAPCEVPIHLISYRFNIPKGIHNEWVVNICPKSSSKQIVHGKAGVTHIYGTCWDFAEFSERGSLWASRRLLWSTLTSVPQAYEEPKNKWCECNVETFY